MKRSEIILMFIQVPLDFLLLTLAGMSAYYLRLSSLAVSWRPVLFVISPGDFLNLIMLVATGWVIIYALAGLYRPDPNRKLLPDLTTLVLASSSGLAAVAVVLLFGQAVFDSRFLILVGWALAIVYVGLGRLFIRGIKSILYRAGIGKRRVAVVGNSGSVATLLSELRERPELGYEVVAEFESVKDLINHKKSLNLDEILYLQMQPSEKEVLSMLEYCHNEHITLKYSADWFATYSAIKRVQPLAGVPLVELQRTPLDGWGRVIKRLFDIVASLFFIVLFSPVFLLSALAILLETGGPIIYKNERVGIRGKIFFVYKFRSMYQKDSTGSQFGEAGKLAEIKERELIKKQNSKVGPIYKITNDPRVTSIGKFIRRFSLDELPQFFNVLGGSMSLVGPRPHQPREVEQYEAEHKRVLIVKPGITGLAQISGRSDLSFAEEIRLDAFYIEHWSLRLDLILMLKTPFIVFKSRKVL